MASGFIYLIILGMWAAYFLPRWISSHEETSGKSAERYKSAMRMVGENGTPTNVPELEAKAKKKLRIAQRRTIFSALAIFFLTISLGVAIRFIPVSILAIPATAILIYIIHVRRQVIQEQLKARRISALQQIGSAALITGPSKRAEKSTAPSTEHWIPFVERGDKTGVVVIPTNGSAWNPTSVPKPTYVSSAKAIPSNRIIDLTVPGVWSAAQEAALQPSRDELFDQELAEAAVENLRNQQSAANE